MLFPRATYHNDSHRSSGTLVSWPATRKYYWSPCFVKSFGDHWVTCVHLVRVTITTIQLKVINSPGSKGLKIRNEQQVTNTVLLYKMATSLR